VSAVLKPLRNVLVNLRFGIVDFESDQRAIKPAYELLSHAIIEEAGFGVGAFRRAGLGAAIIE